MTLQRQTHVAYVMWRQKQTLEFCCQKPENAWDYPRLAGAREDPPLEAWERAWCGSDNRGGDERGASALALRFWPPRLWECTLLFLAAQFWVLCYESPRTPTQTPPLCHLPLLHAPDLNDCHVLSTLVPILSWIRSLPCTDSQSTEI